MSKALTAFSLPIGSLEAYEQAVSQLSMIGAEEEKELATRW